MAIFNGYPATYQNPYMIQQPQYQQPAQQNNGGLIWIQGEAAAKSYLVAPNTSVVLFDSESQTVYIKSADASGMPSMKILDYTIRENAQKSPSTAVPDKPINLSGYATKDEIKPLYAQIAALQDVVDKLTGKEEGK